MKPGKRWRRLRFGSSRQRKKKKKRDQGGGGCTARSAGGESGGSYTSSIRRKKKKRRRRLRKKNKKREGGGAGGGRRRRGGCLGVVVTMDKGRRRLGFLLVPMGSICPTLNKNTNSESWLILTSPRLALRLLTKYLTFKKYYKARERLYHKLKTSKISSFV
ncbi:hypothetical protein PIB30_037674 [Stylosanthes scabra]|uniref:Uncharacterized protein n=1 Tax=Stylosanthes scabra TaxID=79078 RepID=A0ABU6VCE4_9FABA|nr:hypothetical protein [Stylosanthes scabra]